MKVLVPYDGSKESKEALDFSLRIYDEDEIIVLYVIDPVGKGGKKEPKAAWWNMWYEGMNKHASKNLKKAKNIAKEKGKEIKTIIKTGKPSEEILDYTKKEKIDTIVMGRQGESGIARILLGSVADNVSRHADIPVTLVGKSNK